MLTPTELSGRQKVLQTAFQRLLDSKGRKGFKRSDLFRHPSPQSKKAHWQHPICEALIEMGILIRSGPSTSPNYTFNNTDGAQEELTQLLNSKKIEDLVRRPTMLKRQFEPSQEAMFDEVNSEDAMEQPDAQEIDVVTAVTNVSRAVYAISEAVLYLRQMQEHNTEAITALIEGQAQLFDGQNQLNKNIESLTSLIELFLNTTQNTDPSK
jgi:hypothetical protein